MLKNGYIKLHRSILEWEWYKSSNTFIVFMHLLLTANFEQKRFQGEIIQIGERVASYASLSEETGLSIQSIRTAIKRLKSTGEITSRTNRQYTIFTVVNYSQYQGIQQEEQQTDNNQITNEKQANNEQITNERQTNNKRITDEQQTSNKQVSNEQQTINNNERKIKKDKKEKESKKAKEDKEERKQAASGFEDIISEYTQNEDLKTAVFEFIKMRRLIKKPLTDNALKLLLKKLDKLAISGCDGEKIAIFEQSIVNSWQGIFKLKEPYSGTEYNQSQAEISGIDADEESMTEEQIFALLEITTGGGG